MPVTSKKQLRQTLSKRYIHDATSYSASPVIANQAGTQSVPLVWSQALSDLSYSGQGLYKNSWIYVEGSCGPNAGLANIMYQYLVATFNTGTGAFLSQQAARDLIDSAALFEVHTRVSPYDKDNAIDETIKRLRIRQEVALNTIDGALFYVMDGAASPFIIDKILDVHVFANPTGTQDRDVRNVDGWQIVTEATGNELRLLNALQGSQQLVFDAILIPTLGGELATLNIPDERWVLSGAAARCYDFIIQDAPAQQVALLQQRRQEHAMEFSRLSTRFMPVIDKPIRLNDVVAGRGSQYLVSGWW